MMHCRLQVLTASNVGGEHAHSLLRDLWILENVILV